MVLNPAGIRMQPGGRVRDEDTPDQIFSSLCYTTQNPAGRAPGHGAQPQLRGFAAQGTCQTGDRLLSIAHQSDAGSNNT